MLSQMPPALSSSPVSGSIFSDAQLSSTPVAPMRSLASYALRGAIDSGGGLVGHVVRMSCRTAASALSGPVAFSQSMHVETATS